MNTQSVLVVSIASALIIAILYLIFNVLRLTFVFNIAHPFLVLNMAALSAIAVVGLSGWRKLSITRLEWLMIAALLVSFLMADYTDRQPIHILIDIARPLLFLAVIITLRHVVDAKAITTSPTLRKLLPACIWATIAGVVICTVVDNFVKGIYPAYSSIDSLLGLGWLAATGGAAGPLLFLTLLVASGKRAVYLAGGIAMLMVYRKQPKILLAVLGILVAASTASLFNASGYNVQEYYSGGRLDEIRDAIAAMPSPAHSVLGMGPGFAYPSKAFAEQGALHRNLHFTPLSLIIYYGLIFSVLFAIYIARMLPAAWRILNDKSNPVGMSYAMYFFASLPFALTEYSVFAYANVAIACGLIAAFDKNSRAIERT